MEQSIEFVVWDIESISAQLRGHPELVDDFFGRQWVKAFCGKPAANTLGKRLDAQRVTKLRGELARIYAASFSVADSGLIALRSTKTRSVGFLNRFVTPDLISITPHVESLPEVVTSDDDGGIQALLEEAAEQNAATRDDDTWFLRDFKRMRRRTEIPQVSDRRSADQWIGTTPLHVVVGNPGAGKSTLLRYLVLDLLRNEPTWGAVAERWGERLPVWLPFHFFTQRVSGHTGAAASIAETLRAWLEQHDTGHVWPLVQQALEDERLLLVVDGLDEWLNDDAGRYAIAALEAFAESHATPLVVSTRPYGLSRLNLAAGWTYTRIATLNAAQQRQLALHYFHATLDTEGPPASTSVIEQSVDGFLSEVHSKPDLHAISGTPLFLVLLVGLRLSTLAKLPTERFDVYDKAVQLLVADHPARRRVAAAVTAPRQRLSDRQLRAILAKVAFECHSRGDISTSPESKLREDFLNALHHLPLSSADAAAAADELLDIAEGELGLLVRQSPTELGFLHRALQEQLAAEHISSELNLDEVHELFSKHLQDSSWREVLLATMWKIPRPSERSSLLEVIRECVDETPAGLRSREMLAEVIFGPYGLPTSDIRRDAPAIVRAIETHTYAPHRARLLGSILAGLEEAGTGEIVRECLERWTLLVQEPSSELVWEIARLPIGTISSESVCDLLVMALRYPEDWVAYSSAAAIAARCSDKKLADSKERNLFRTELLRLLSDPPSGLAQAAALMALALEWRDDPLVVEILNEARNHTETSVRVVALSDALGVLQSTFSDSPPTIPSDVLDVSYTEREWLIGHLESFSLTDAHWGLHLATVTEAIRDQKEALDNLVLSLQSVGGPYRNGDMLWPVALNLLANDRRVVGIICNRLRSTEHFSLGLRMMSNITILASAYPPGSPRHSQVAAAIEERMDAFGTKIFGPELLRLAAVDRGPVMKRVLLERLGETSLPHWAADALAEYFNDDEEVMTALHSVLMGDPVQASRIANVTTRVLPTNQVLPRLLEILRLLANSTNAQSGRYDFVASAIVETCEGRVMTPEIETLIEEAMNLLPERTNPLGGDSRHHFAAALYPSPASKRALAELSQIKGRPLAPYLRAFGNDLEKRRPFLTEAWRILHTLPAYLRAQLCQYLADRMLETSLVMQFTSGWADDVSGFNKSIASLAYHRALLRAREEGGIDDEHWTQEMVHLEEEASCYGFDHEARRRSAWVGMCVCGDWSMLDDRMERADATTPIRVPLADSLYGPDRILVQELAMCWESLRMKFGEGLLSRFSGLVGQQSANDVWNALALVADQDVALGQELDSLIADDPELLNKDNIFLWFTTRRSTNADAITSAFIARLQQNSEHHERIVGIVAAEPERFGLDREQLLTRIETIAGSGPAAYGDSALEMLAVLKPEHPTVRSAWGELSKVLAGRGRPSEHPVHAPTYFGLAYAAIGSSEVSAQIRQDLDRLNQIGIPYLDGVFAYHVARRLRRDNVAAIAVRDAVIDETTPDFLAAPMVALLADAIGIDEELLQEMERRIMAQDDIVLAPIVRDRSASATLSVRTVYTRVAESARDMLAT
ncbi:MAG: NACHT domain-containing protein [Chloroflexota bacterium]|nr:NACHT domain-containing protein [Chloroflexota bacterium]